MRACRCLLAWGSPGFIGWFHIWLSPFHLGSTRPTKRDFIQQLVGFVSFSEPPGIDEVFGHQAMKNTKQFRKDPVNLYWSWMSNTIYICIICIYIYHYHYSCTMYSNTHIHHRFLPICLVTQKGKLHSKLIQQEHFLRWPGKIQVSNFWCLNFARPFFEETRSIPSLFLLLWHRRQLS